MWGGPGDARSPCVDWGLSADTCSQQRFNSGDFKLVPRKDIKAAKGRVNQDMIKSHGSDSLPRAEAGVARGGA